MFPRCAFVPALLYCVIGLHRSCISFYPSLSLFLPISPLSNEVCVSFLPVYVSRSLVPRFGRIHGWELIFNITEHSVAESKPKSAPTASWLPFGYEFLTFLRKTFPPETMLWRLPIFYGIYEYIHTTVECLECPDSCRTHDT